MDRLSAAEAVANVQPFTPALSEAELQHLAELAVDARSSDLLAQVRGLAMRHGWSTEEVLFKCIGGVANYLGERWLVDGMSFSDVTFGSDTLQRAIAEIGYEAEGPLVHREIIVLTAAPGEQHVLPIYALAETLRSQGWETHVEAQMDSSDLLDLVASEPVAAVGVTCKSVDRLVGLEGLAAKLRKASPWPLQLLLGGCDALRQYAPKLGFLYLSSGSDVNSYLASGKSTC